MGAEQSTATQETETQQSASTQETEPQPPAQPPEPTPPPAPTRPQAPPRGQPKAVPNSNPKMKLNLYNIHMSLTNVIQYVSFSSPLLLVFFITLYSIVQNNYLSGLIFNMGIVIISSIVYLLKHILKNKQQTAANPFCNVLPSPFSVHTFDENIGQVFYDSPSFSSAILSFSAAYLIYPMIIKNQQNTGLLVFSIVLVLVNAVTEIMYKCCGLFGIILGILLGILFAILYYSLLMSSNYTASYLYFHDNISNNTQCTKPGTQNFKCSLYKNGVAINAVGT